jgi:hypothetical protein
MATATARFTMARHSIMQMAVVLLLLTVNCTFPQKTKMQKFEWQPTTSAPKEYPVRLLSALLHLADGEHLAIQPKALIANGWGEIGAVSLIGEDLKTLPAELEVLWFSYTERKCYGGRFKLDQGKLTEKFQKKMIAPATDAAAVFTHLVIGFAPKGGISIWFSGEGGTEEVSHFTAAEVQFDMQAIIGTYPNVEVYAKDVIAQNLPTGSVKMSGHTADDFMKWSGRYRQDYRWHWAITATAPTRGVLAHYFNGEEYYWPQTPGKATSFTHPLPDAITVRWGDGSDSETLHFDDVELFAAFDKLGGAGKEAGILLELNRVTGSGKAFVQNESSIIELKNTKVGD